MAGTFMGDINQITGMGCLKCILNDYLPVQNGGERLTFEQQYTEDLNDVMFGKFMDYLFLKDSHLNELNIKKRKQITNSLMTTNSQKKYKKCKENAK